MTQGHAMEAMESMLVVVTKDWHFVQMRQSLIYNKGSHPFAESHLFRPSCRPDMNKQDCPPLLSDMVKRPHTIGHIV